MRQCRQCGWNYFLEVSFKTSFALRDDKNWEWLQGWLAASNGWSKGQPSSLCCQFPVLWLGRAVGASGWTPWGGPGALWITGKPWALKGNWDKSQETSGKRLISSGCTEDVWLFLCMNPCQVGQRRKAKRDAFVGCLIPEWGNPNLGAQYLNDFLTSYVCLAWFDAFIPSCRHVQEYPADQEYPAEQEARPNTFSGFSRV